MGRGRPRAGRPGGVGRRRGLLHDGGARPGKTLLHLFDTGPAVEPGIGSSRPGALVLVEGAVPEPWRRLPDPVPDAVPAPTADAALLERTLREPLPGAIGATEEGLAAVEERLDVALPEEWRVLLDAGAVPRGLSAAAIEVRGERNPLEIMDLANEILALRNRPPITRTVVEADLGPVG
ncbi:hypothetical protein ACFQ67_12250 [Streptomyces sp. NPDC056488]|uniref:hypothetical protein n=1 Tax=Streptomyces sp. NPDC056488 TaxID=3345836 RepID=UPI0036B1DC6D